MARKPRVLLLLHDLSLTGAPRVALNTFEEIQRDVCLQTLALKEGPLREQCAALGPLKVFSELPPETTFIQRQLRRVRAREWRRSLQAWRPDIIYANSVAACAWAASLALPNAPVLLHVHEMRYVLESHERWFPGYLKNWPSRYIAVSEAVRRDLVDHFDVDPEKMVVIHESIKEKDLETLPLSDRKEERFTVGGAGTVEWRKGTLLWLQMAVELQHIVGPDRVRFVWVGVKEDEKGRQFRETARKLGVDPLIEFVPLTPEPLKHFAKFDLFAMTSWEDPCPLVVLENMLLGTPVACFAGSGGAPEEVGETGIVVEGFSPIKMAQSIAELIQAPERRAAMGKAARARVLEHFTASVQAPKILAEIQKLVHK